MEKIETTCVVQSQGYPHDEAPLYVSLENTSNYLVFYHYSNFPLISINPPVGILF